ncbi:hypothetical protein OAG94_00515 [bacterium]|nr:hypothetical protein [bacterium]
MWESGLVWQDIPRGEKEGWLGRALGQGREPRFEFLLELLLKFTGRADDEHRPALEGMGQNSCRKGPSALADAAERQYSPRLRAVQDGL